MAAKRIIVRFVRNGFKEVMSQSGLRKFTRIQDYKRNLRQLIGVLRSSRTYYHDQAVESPADFLDSHAYSRGKRMVCASAFRSSRSEPRSAPVDDTSQTVGS